MRSSPASKLAFISLTAATVGLVVWAGLGTAQPVPSPDLQLPVAGEGDDDDDDSASEGTTMPDPPPRSPCEIVGETGIKLGDHDCDTIPDLIDDCPELPETINDYRDYDGCPDEAAIRYHDPDTQMQQQVQVQEVIESHRGIKNDADRRNLELLRTLLDTNAEGARIMIEELEKLQESNAPPPAPEPVVAPPKGFPYEYEDKDEADEAAEAEEYGPWDEEESPYCE